MKIIIIGNGFDLHHKYKTSFYDFRTHLKNSKNKKNQILISKIDELLEVTDNEQKPHLLWNDFESIIGDLMKSEQYKKHKVKDIPSLVEKFTQNFYEYLTTISNKKILKINKEIEKEFEDVSTILTFNYTSFYSSYSLIGDIDVFHIHGNLTEKDLPIIGYYYPNALITNSTNDYSVKYGGKLIHKAALSLKQNEIDLDERIRKYTAKWKNKITEIVILGYSFGQSDGHIYKIIDDLMIQQIKDINVPSSRAEKIKLIKFIIYSYDDKESNLLIERIKSYIAKFGRRFSINVTGLGFASEERDILTFELKKY
jgi:hypothetical protein